MENNKKKWLSFAIGSQKLFSQFFFKHDLDEVLPEKLMEKLVSHAYFFDPAAKKKESSTKRMKKIFDTIKDKGQLLKSRESSDRVYHLSCLYIFFTPLDFDLSKSSIYTLFVVRSKTQQKIFIDGVRIYSSWGDYLKNNILPKGYIYFPKYGSYYRCRKFHLKKTVRCHLVKTIGRTIENVSTVVGLTGALVSSTSLFFTLPIVAPALLTYSIAASSIISFVSGTTKLHDMSTHGQSLSASNPQALVAYLDMISGVGGLVSRTAALKALKLDAERPFLARFLKFVAVAGNVPQVLQTLGTCFSVFIGENLTEETILDFFRVFFNVYLDKIHNVPMLVGVMTFFLTWAVFPNSTGFFIRCNNYYDIVNFAVKLLVDRFPILQGIEKVITPTLCSFDEKLGEQFPIVKEFRVAFRDIHKFLRRYFDMKTIETSSPLGLYKVYLLVSDVLKCFVSKNNISGSSVHDKKVEELLDYVKWFHKYCFQSEEFISYNASSVFLRLLVDNSDILKIVYFCPAVTTADFFESRRVFPLAKSLVSSLNVHDSYNQGENECLIPLKHVAVYTFLKPREEVSNLVPNNNRCLKHFYRQKASSYVGELVSKSNSKFVFSSGTIHIKMSLEKSHWRLISFCEICLTEVNQERSVQILAILRAET